MRTLRSFHQSLMPRWLLKHKVSGECVKVNGKTFQDACKTMKWSERNTLGVYLGNHPKNTPIFHYVKPSKPDTFD
jgi:hypothetical protein